MQRSKSLDKLRTSRRLPSVVDRSGDPDAGPAPTPGWFLAAFSTELQPGQALGVTIAGQHIALFRGQSGTVAATDRYCSHLGGNLADGTVVGDTLRCPFHHWRFDAHGTCVEIPGCQKIPPKAKVSTFPVVERLAGIWVYVGGRTPYFEVPSEKELFGGDCYLASADDFGELHTSSRDILENAVDLAHSPTLHSVETTEWSLQETEGPIFRLLGEFATGDIKFKTGVDLYGPGLWISWMSGKLILPSFWFFCLVPTPVSARVTRFRAITFMRGNARLPWTWLLGKFAAYGTRLGVKQDINIWDDKVEQAHPVLSSFDGPIMKYRTWFSQLPALARAADGLQEVGDRLVPGPPSLRLDTADFAARLDGPRDS